MTLRNRPCCAWLKYQKHSLKQESFNPAQVDHDGLFVLLPKSDGYTELDSATFNAICRGEFRF